MTPTELGPYRILHELGRGGMGVVYAAEDPRLGRRVALKLLARGLLDAEALLRFSREADALARVDHPHVLRVHARLETERGPCLVSELIEGESLEALLARGPLDPGRARALVAALADAVAAVHAAGVLHRDLKPSNVLVRADGSPVLLDFGLARELDARTLTQTGSLLGTPAYMAPEQARGASPRELDARVDVYGLGALLFACLTGEAPFRGSSPFVTLQHVLSREPEWPASAPPALVAIGRAAMAKAPSARPPDAPSLGRLLRAEEPVPAEAAGRRRAWVLALAAAAVAAAALLSTEPAVRGDASGALPPEEPPALPAGEPDPLPPEPAEPPAPRPLRVVLTLADELESPTSELHSAVLLTPRHALGATLVGQDVLLRRWGLSPGLPYAERRLRGWPVAFLWDERRGLALAAGFPSQWFDLESFEAGALTIDERAHRSIAFASEPGGDLLVGFEGGVGLLTALGEPFAAERALSGEALFLVPLEGGALAGGVGQPDPGGLWGVSIEPFAVTGALGLPFRPTAMAAASAHTAWVGLRQGHLLECGVEGGRPVFRRALADPELGQVNVLGLEFMPAAAEFPWPRAHDSGVTALAPARGGRLLCVGVGDVWQRPIQGGELAVWDVLAGEVVRRIRLRRPQPIVSLAARDLTPERTQLLVCYRGEAFDLYDLVIR